jgi:hypothetical protein
MRCSFKVRHLLIVFVNISSCFLKKKQLKERKEGKQACFVALPYVVMMKTSQQEVLHVTLYLSAWLTDSA